MMFLLLVLQAVFAFSLGSRLPHERFNDGPPSFELLNYNPVAAAGASVTQGKARFTVLTPNVIRMEYSDSGSFEDRPTLAVLNRDLPTVPFQHTVDGDTLKITSTAGSVVLQYKINQPFSGDSLVVTGNGKTAFKSWQYGQPNYGNLLGTIKSLDQLGAETLNCTLNANVSVHDESLHCEWGLVSRDGWAILDDSSNWALTKGAEWWDSENTDSVDMYIFTHGHDYKGAIADYVSISGHVPLLPRYSLGVWWTRWYDLNGRDVRKVVEDYESRSIPLDVFVLDMDWHKKDNWGGFTFDEHLFKNPNFTMSWLQRKGLHISANLHDANGVGNYDDQFDALCKYLGLDPTKISSVPFSIVNKTYVYGLEDIVLEALYKQGLQFWWIDWQQGGKAGGAAGGKQNPTIMTNKIRVTDMKRQGKNERGLVLARWGGLGTHRYNVGFTGSGANVLVTVLTLRKGDVAGLSWANLAYQPYFSLTAANVAYGWISHDIEGPNGDHELYTRWVQWAAFSGVLRSHDRGMSAGTCYDTDSCSHVRIWETPTKYFEAMRDAMQTRDAMLPYVYTMARQSFDTGLGALRPMYYEYPELDSAYTCDATGNGCQYFFGDDMIVHPITVASGDAQLATVTIWVPPGTWFDTVHGKTIKGAPDGSTSMTASYDLTEVPVFVRAGAVIPTIPVRTGATLGLATKQYTELEFSVYPGATAGSTAVYEDDAHTRNYLTGQFAWTNGSYTVANGELTFKAATTGHYDEMPTSRVFRLKIINGNAPSSVTVDGVAATFNVDGGPNTWRFCGDQMAVIVETKPVASTTIVVGGRTDSGLDGLRGAVSHAILSKRNLDETRQTLGAHKPQGGKLMDAASIGEYLEYLAGHDAATFKSTISGYWTLYDAAIAEVKGMGPTNASTLQTVFNSNDNDHILCGNPQCLTENQFPKGAIEGYMPIVGEPGTVPLYLYWNNVQTGSKDNFATTSTSPPKGYVPADFGIDGYIFTEPKTGTQPLYLYFNEQLNDHMTVGSADSIAYAKGHGYALVSTLGHVYSSPPKGQAILSGVNPKRLAYSLGLLESAKQ